MFEVEAFHDFSRIQAKIALSGRCLLAEYLALGHVIYGLAFQGNHREFGILIARVTVPHNEMLMEIFYLAFSPACSLQFNSKPGNTIYVRVSFSSLSTRFLCCSSFTNHFCAVFFSFEMMKSVFARGLSQSKKIGRTKFV